MSESVEMAKRERPSGWQPPELIQLPSIFVWPPQLRGLLKSLFGFPGYLWPWNTLYAAISLVTWHFLTPDFGRMKTLSVDWIGIIFFRNLALIVLIAGAWHLRLYVQRARRDQLQV